MLDYILFSSSSSFFSVAIIIVEIFCTVKIPKNHFDGIFDKNNNSNCTCFRKYAVFFHSLNVEIVLYALKTIFLYYFLLFSYIFHLINLIRINVGEKSMFVQTMKFGWYNAYYLFFLHLEAYFQILMIIGKFTAWIIRSSAENGLSWWCDERIYRDLYSSLKCECLLLSQLK